MEPFIFEELTIEVKETADTVVITWLGKSRNLNPATILVPYFNSLMPHLIGKNVEIDFTRLNLMNSSTVHPILTFIKKLSAKDVNTLVKYDSSLTWQKASFDPLSIVFACLPHIKFVSIN